MTTTRAASLAAVRDDLRVLANAVRCAVPIVTPLGKHRCALRAGHEGGHKRGGIDEGADRG